MALYFWVIRKLYKRRYFGSKISVLRLGCKGLITKSATCLAKRFVSCLSARYLTKPGFIGDMFMPYLVRLRAFDPPKYSDDLSPFSRLCKNCLLYSPVARNSFITSPV